MSPTVKRFLLIFFISLGWLEQTYAVPGEIRFVGRVVSGMPVVDAITEMELDLYGRYGPRNRPYPVDAKIVSIRIESAGASEVAQTE